MFKKPLIVLLIISMLLIGVVPALGGVIPPDSGDIDVAAISFFGEAARALQDTEEESSSYISSIILTLGSDTMVVDGEKTSVLSPQTDGSQELLPIVDIAEALGAEIDINAATGEIAIMDDGGIAVLDEPQPSKDAQLYDIQKVADVLTLDYTVEGESIILTRPFQSKMLLVRMKSGKQLPGLYGAADSASDGKGRYVLKFDSISQAKEGYEAIKALPDCENVAPNRAIFAFDAPEAGELELFALPGPNWGAERIHAELMKGYLTANGYTSNDIKVAVIDSGALSIHPHLAGRVIQGRNFSSSQPDNPDYTADGYGHGTLVSGNIVTCTPNNVKIMPVKVLNNSGQGLETHLTDAIIWSADNGAKVINMSLGVINSDDGPDWDMNIKEACEYAVSKGSVIVTAAGNAGNGEVPLDTKFVSPARLDCVITVTATDKNDEIADFSYFGDAVDVAAPGVDILSSSFANTYRPFSGTSAAATFVTAAAAMITLDKPSLGPEGLKTAVTSIAIDLGDTGWDRIYGWGLIDFALYPTHVHNWGAGITTPPTCTEDGYTTYICTICGEKRIEAGASATGHTEGEKVTVKEPTCTELGEWEIRCEVCDELRDSGTIPATGHTEGAKVTVKEPTTTEKGLWEIRCEVCGDLIKSGEIPAHEHDWNAGITTPPTCTKDGYTTYTCAACGEKRIEAGASATGHTKGEKVTVKEPTCVELGEWEIRCSVCEEVLKTGTIPTIEHTEGEKVTVKEPTCVELGEWEIQCSVCEEVLKTGTIPTIEHTEGEKKTVKEPTTTETGEWEIRCEVCEELLDSGEIPAKGVINVVFKSLTANGKAKTDTTTALTLTFDRKIPWMIADYIKVTGATKGTLTGTGPEYTLSISGTWVEGAKVTVTVNHPVNYEVTPESLVVFVHKADTPGSSSFNDGQQKTTQGSPVVDSVELKDNDQQPLTGVFAAFINGYPDNTVRGTMTISREEFVNILYKTSNPDSLPQTNPLNQTFKDVASSRWSYDAIEWAAEAGVIEADSQGNFLPAAPLTRAAMAEMLVRREGWTEKAMNTFTDIGAHPRRDDILMAVKAGIFKGYTDGTFGPDNFATRYEVITAMVRYLLGSEPTDDMWEGIPVTFVDISRDHWAYKYVALSTTGYLPLPAVM